MKTINQYSTSNKAVRIMLALILILGLAQISTFTKVEQAYAATYDDEQVDSDYMFSRTNLNMNIDNAVIDTVDITNPNGTFIQEVNGFVREGTGWQDVVYENQGYTVRIPVRAINDWNYDNLVSNAEGQALLNGVSISVTWKNVGTYTQADGTEKAVKMKLSVSNMVDALPKQRLNNYGPTFSLPISGDTNALDIWGDAAHMGHGYYFKFLPSEIFKNYNVNYECHLQGIEAAEMTLEIVYEDGSPVMLDDGEGFLATVGQIDGDNLGAEGIRIAGNPEKGYITTHSSILRGSIERSSGYQGNLFGFSPSLNNAIYLDSLVRPVYYGTLPDTNIPNWVKANLNYYDQATINTYNQYSYLDDFSDAGITWLSGTDGVTPAKAVFTLIDQVGAIGYPVSFGTITAYQPKEPVKTVDKTEAAIGEEITYQVKQQINNRGNDARYDYTYSSFVFKDTLDAALTYKDLKVLDGAGADVTATAGTFTRSGNDLTYTFSKDYLDNTMEYKGETYTFEIKAEVTNPSAGLEIIDNQAQTIFNSRYTLDTNEVSTIVNTAELSLDKSVDYEHRVGDDMVYTLTVNNTQEDSIAKNVVVVDNSLPSDVVIKDVVIEGVPEAVSYPVIKDGVLGSEPRANSHSFTAQGNALSVNIAYLPYNTPVTISFVVEAMEKYNGFELVNTASATLDNPSIGADETVYASDIIWINTPDITPVKTTDSVVHEVGDTIKYKIDVTNEHVGTVARNVIIIDNFDTPGVELDRNSIVVADSNGNIITGSCTITQNVLTQGFKVETHRNLVNSDDYTKYDSENGFVNQKVQNPIGETLETSFYIEYTAKVTDPELAGKPVHNTVITDCDENPGGTDETETPVSGPVLNIQKSVDKKTVSVDERVTYTLKVTQIREKVTAENVVITDAFETDNANVIADTIKLYDEKWNDITEGCAINTDNGINIETHRNLDDTQAIYVVYDAIMKSVPQDGKLTNIATASADNATEVTDKEIITVVETDPGKLEVVKSSDPVSGSMVKAGDVITYTLTFENVGGTSLYDIAIYDAIPDNTSFVSLEENRGASYNEETNSIGWNIASITPGERIALSFKVMVNDDLAENTTIYNMASYAPNTPGIPTDPLPDETNEVEHPVESGKLEVVKSSDPLSGSMVKAGDVITYTLTLKNVGGTSLYDIAIYDAIPEYTTYVSHVDAHRATLLEGQRAMAWNIEEIAPNESVELAFKVKVDEGLAGRTQIKNVASYTPDSPDMPQKPLENQTNEVTHHTPDSQAQGSGHDQTGNPFGTAPWVALGLLLTLAATLTAYGVRTHKQAALEETSENKTTE